VAGSLPASALTLLWMAAYPIGTDTAIAAGALLGVLVTLTSIGAGRWALCSWLISIPCASRHHA
jgi:hypothetical protein